MSQVYIVCIKNIHTVQAIAKISSWKSNSAADKSCQNKSTQFIYSLVVLAYTPSDTRCRYALTTTNHGQNYSLTV